MLMASRPVETRQSPKDYDPTLHGIDLQANFVETESQIKAATFFLRIERYSSITDGRWAWLESPARPPRGRRKRCCGKGTGARRSGADAQPVPTRSFESVASLVLLSIHPSAGAAAPRRPQTRRD